MLKRALGGARPDQMLLAPKGVAVESLIAAKQYGQKQTALGGIVDGGVRCWAAILSCTGL